MRRLTLTEYRTQQVRLDGSQVLALRQLVPSLAITPSLPGDAELCDVTPGSEVGSVRVDDLFVEIRPKIGIRRLLFLLSFVADPAGWRSESFDFPEETTLVEAIVPGFCKQLDQAFAPGVLQGYQTEDDALQVVRGRVRFDDQLRRRFGRFPPAEVRFDDFTEDIELNRVLKAAIAALGQLPLRSAGMRARLRHQFAKLNGVRLVHYSQLPSFTYDRLTERYRPAVDLARLILRYASIEQGFGATRSAALMVDMNRAFEDFVVVALREALRLSSAQFVQGANKRRVVLDAAGRVRMEPDISWWDRGRCVFVGDVKYRRVAPAGFKHTDLYQLLAYTIATGLETGLLIYAAGEATDVVHDITLAGKRLAITTLDVTGEPDEILRKVAGVAERVRNMRAAALVELAPEVSGLISA